MWAVRLSRLLVEADAEALAEPWQCLGKRNLSAHHDDPATRLLARYLEK